MHRKLEKRASAVLAARHAELADSLRSLLLEEFRDVALVADLRALQEALSRVFPSVVVVDLPLAGCTAPEVLRSVRSVWPAALVIVLLAHDQAAVARMALQSGAQGVVLERSAGVDLHEAVETVMRGGVYVSPGFGATVKSDQVLAGKLVQ